MPDKSFPIHPIDPDPDGLTLLGPNAFGACRLGPKAMRSRLMPTHDRVLKALAAKDKAQVNVPTKPVPKSLTPLA